MKLCSADLPWEKRSLVYNFATSNLNALGQISRNLTLFQDLCIKSMWFLVPILCYCLMHSEPTLGKEIGPLNSCWCLWEDLLPDLKKTLFFLLQQRHYSPDTPQIRRSPTIPQIRVWVNEHNNIMRTDVILQDHYSQYQSFPTWSTWIELSNSSHLYLSFDLILISCRSYSDFVGFSQPPLSPPPFFSSFFCPYSSLSVYSTFCCLEQ